MAKIKSARIGTEGEHKFFCEVTLDGAAEVVTRAETASKARHKAKEYCAEHYGQKLLDEHFPAEQRSAPAPAKEEKKKPAPLAKQGKGAKAASEASPKPQGGGDPAAKDSPEQKPAGDEQAPPLVPPKDGEPAPKV